MKNINRKLRFVWIFTRKSSLIMLAVIYLSVTINAQTTLFSFQAALPNDVTPATDVYEMEFKLFDAPAAGNQVGATNLVSAVAVKNRNFTVWLDFGAEAFPGADRFIEISYRRNDNQPFTIVSLRERVLSVPYSIRSLTAATADNSLNLNGVSASNYVQTTDSRLSDERNPLPGSNNYIQNTTVQQAPANFNISGNGTANIFNAAAQYNLGGERILSGGPFNGNLSVGFGTGIVNNSFGNTFIGSGAGKFNLGGVNTFIGNNAGMNNSSGGSNTFVGFAAGEFNTTGRQNVFVGFLAGNSNTTGTDNSYFGRSAGFMNTTGRDNSFFGNSAGRSATTSSNNTFVGANAGSGTTSGSENTFVGRGAGLNHTVGRGNTLIGDLSGFSSPSTVLNVNNTLLGSNTRADAGVFNSTAVGTGAAVTESNTIVLGTDAQTTYIPGGAANTFNVNNSFRGIIVNNLLFRNLANFIPTSSSPVCFRFMTIQTPTGLDGGYGLTNCNSSSSSAAFKTDVEPFTGGLEIIKSLKPVAFKWKGNGAGDIGLNAEDVAGVAPQLVRRNLKGEVEDVKEHSLNVVFINAFKEQQAQIVAQQKQIDRQQQQIDELKKLICQTSAQTDVCK